ncbi:MAG: glycosyltransferase family 4 protein [Vicinamibacterales bacterium]
MRILILSQYYAPEPIPKPADLARELARLGHDVHVLTGIPHYPTGRIAPGYRARPIQEETIDGLPVTRTWEYAYHGTHALRRLLNYASFMVSAPLGAWRLGRFDAIYVWHPPLSVGVAAWLVGRITRAPFVYDVQDIWPDAAVLAGLMKPGRMVSAMRRLERFVYRRAAHLLVVTEGARQNLIAKGVPPDHVTPLLQWVDDAVFDAVDPAAVAAAREACGGDGRFLVLFTGNLGLVQGLDTIVRAAARLRDTPLRLAFVGDGADRARLEALTRDLGAGDVVTFVDRRPAAEMPAFMAAADALVAHLRPSELSRYVIPSKTMSYLAAGRPIVMAMEGAAADLVREAGAGVTTAPGDPDALAAAIRDLMARPDAARAAMGARGRAFARAHLTRDALVPRYEAILARAARGNPRARHADASHSTGP